MTARDIYEQQTGRQAYLLGSTGMPPYKDYVEWLERIAETTAGMVGVVPSEKSIHDADDLEELHDLFQRNA